MRFGRVGSEVAVRSRRRQRGRRKARGIRPPNSTSANQRKPRRSTFSLAICTTQATYVLAGEVEGARRSGCDSDVSEARLLSARAEGSAAGAKQEGYARPIQPDRKANVLYGSVGDDANQDGLHFSLATADVIPDGLHSRASKPKSKPRRSTFSLAICTTQATYVLAGEVEEARRSGCDSDVSEARLLSARAEGSAAGAKQEEYARPIKPRRKANVLYGSVGGHVRAWKFALGFTNLPERVENRT